MSALLEDEHTQKAGVVDIVWNCDGQALDARFLARSGALSAALPYRIRGLHYCMNEDFLEDQTVDDFVRPLHKSAKLRFRVHTGTKATRKELLSSFYTVSHTTFSFY